MRIFAFVALFVFALPPVFVPSPLFAAPVVQVEGGYVDWCQGFTDAREEARCINGQFAFDAWGNLLEDLDGPGPDDDDS